MRSSVSDWDKNVETVLQWSPYFTEEDLLRQVMLLFSSRRAFITSRSYKKNKGFGSSYFFSKYSVSIFHLDCVLYHSFDLGSQKLLPLY